MSKQKKFPSKNWFVITCCGLTEKYPNAIFVSSTKGTNLESLVSEITKNVFGEIKEVVLFVSPKDLDQLHKYSSIISVENNEEGLEVVVKIRNYYLENLLQKDVVKLLSWMKLLA